GARKLAVEAEHAEVLREEAERGAGPDHRAAAEAEAGVHAAAPRVAGQPVLALGPPDAAHRELVLHERRARVLVGGAGLEQHDGKAGLGEPPAEQPAGRPGADDADVDWRALLHWVASSRAGSGSTMVWR